MSVMVNVARAILAVVGGIALLLAVGNLATGGGSITDPVFPFGVAFGALVSAAAAWTTAPRRWQAVVVWLGVLAILIAFVAFLVSIGDAALRDVLIYFGIPAAIVLAATAVVAVARVRAGALGRPSTD